MEFVKMPNQVRALRQRAGISKETLATVAGCSVASVITWEREPHRSPYAPLLPGLAAALNCSMAEVLGVPEPDHAQAQALINALRLTGRAVKAA